MTLKQNKSALAFGIITLITILSYWHALFGEFIGDDYLRIVEAEYWLKQGYSFALNNILPDRPILMATIWGNYLLGGLNPIGYKIFSLALFLAVGFLFFQLLLFIEVHHLKKKRIGIISFCTLLFMLQPVNSQAIISIIQRGVLLAALGGLGSFLFFIKHLELQKREYYLYSLLFYTLGILSKPIIITFPVMFLLYLIFMKKLNTENIKKISLFFLISLIPVIFYLFSGFNNQAAIGALPWYKYFLLQTKVIFIYFKLFFLPTNLHFFYDFDKNVNIQDVFMWLAILGHCLLIFSGFKLFKSLKLVSFGIMAMYISFLPESSFFPIKHIVFEHRTFIPYLLICFIFYGLLQHYDFKYKKISLSISILCLLFLGGQLIKRTHEIDSLEKWTINTFSYRKPTRENKMVLLNDIYVTGNNTLGASYSNKFISEDPQYFPYHLFYKIFTSAKEERKATIEEVANYLMHRSNGEGIDSTTRNNFLEYVINQSPNFAGSIENYYKKLEVLFRSQILAFTLAPEDLQDKIRIYYQNLRALFLLYTSKQKKINLEESEVLQFAHVAKQLSSNTPPQNQEFYSATIKNLKNNYSHLHDKIKKIESLYDQAK